jgi:hypothetical protein
MTPGLLRAIYGIRWILHHDPRAHTICGSGWNRIGSQQICEGGGIELYVDIETYIAFSCTLLRELGCSAVHSFGRSSSSRRGAGICGANFDTGVARDAAGEHRNSTR